MSPLARLRSSPGIQAVGTIAGGAALGQGIALAASPVLTRLYTPENFGIYGAFTAMVGILGVVSAGRFELAIPSARDRADSQTLIGLGLACLTIVSLLGLVVALWLGSSIEDVLKLPGLTQTLWLVPIASSLTGAFLLLNQLAIREGKFRLIGSRNTIYGLVMVIAQIILGVLGLGNVGLGAGVALASLGGTLLLLRGSGLQIAALRKSWSGPALRRVLSAHRRYPLLLVPAGILNAAGLQLPLLIMAGSYGAKVAGWLGLTQRVLTLPVALVGTALAQVYLSRVAAVHRGGGDVRALFVRASKHLALVGALGGAVLVVASPTLFAIVFGSSFRPSGEYARALAVGFVGQLVAAPLSQTLIVLGRQGWQLVLDVGRAVVLCGLVYAAARSGASPTEAVWALGTGLALSYGFAWWACLRAVRTP